jgi:hypothetical protein
MCASLKNMDINTTRKCVLLVERERVCVHACVRERVLTKINLKEGNNTPRTLLEKMNFNVIV